MKSNIVNVTPHSLRFISSVDGSVYEVAPFGKLVNAKAQDQVVKVLSDGSELVKVVFSEDPASLAVIDEIEATVPNAIIVGSLIAAQAYPGRVVAMVAAPGFERVPPDQKKMRDDRFTTF
jgi:hypothetical protein